jgi:nicotinamidase-related amidase
MKNDMLRLLTPDDSAIVLLDHQAQSLFSVQSHERESIINHVIALVEVAKVFKVPTVVSILDSQNFGGPLFQELEPVLSGLELIDRTSINAWEDKRFQSAIKETGRKNLAIAGLSTESAVTLTALSAMRDNYEVFIVADACGSASREVHERALDRMFRAGAIPTAWQQVAYELQADWARQETAEPLRQIIRHHCGGFAPGVFQPQAMHAAGQEKAQTTTRVS